MSAQFLKCGCIFDGRSFTRYCREHGMKLLKTRWEKALEKAQKPARGGDSLKGRAE